LTNYRHYASNNNNNNNNNSYNTIVIIKEAEKKLQYKNVSVEIQRMLNMKCFVLPVIIGATEIISKSLKNIWKRYQNNINRFPTKDHHTRNITHHMESATTCDLKPEWWGSPLAQEAKNQGKGSL
jgi:hypothetical protein